MGGIEYHNTLSLSRGALIRCGAETSTKPLNIREDCHEP